VEGDHRWSFESRDPSIGRAGISPLSGFIKKIGKFRYTS